jgi:molybdate transport system substrate-binding protein
LALGQPPALLGNQLVWWWQQSAATSVRAGLLERLPVSRIAAGDPAHVPVGKYAPSGRRSSGVVRRQAHRAATTSVPGAGRARQSRHGIVYRTDAAISKQVIVAGTFPATSHDAIVYPVAMLRGNAQGAALKLYEFLASPQAREIFTRHGFASR